MLGDPVRDVRDDIAETSNVPEFADKIWFHKTAGAVIEPDRCVGCGGCVAACPSRSIEIAEDGRPTLVGMCTGCSFCWDVCPMAGLNVGALAAHPVAGRDGTGSPSVALAARARRPVAGAQDGGVVTALLSGLLRAGRIDAALVTQRLDAFEGEALLATTPEQIEAAAGSVYHQANPLALLGAPPPEGIGSIAVVGTPCQIAALRMLQMTPWRYRRSAAHLVTLTVGLFCTRSFSHSALRAAVTELIGEQVDRIDVRDGRLSASRDGERVMLGPVADFRAAALRGCDECSDLTAELADVAVGNLGSPHGFTTVLLRTPVGEEAWEQAGEAFETLPLTDPAAVARAEERNRREARRVRPIAAPPAELRIGYVEHLEAYSATDRSHVAPPPHRSHHYRTSC